MIVAADMVKVVVNLKMHLPPHIQTKVLEQFHSNDHHKFLCRNT